VHTEGIIVSIYHKYPFKVFIQGYVSRCDYLRYVFSLYVTDLFTML